jgi:putative transposase
MTLPRQIIPGRAYLITRRTVQRQFLLRPDEKTNQILLYCLAVALARYGMEVYVFNSMSNHYHLVVFDVCGRLPEFLWYLNLMTAKALNFRWRRRENLWSVEQANVVLLVDDEAVLASSVYTLVNPSRRSG